jgi:hypothetical protein
LIAEGGIFFVACCGSPEEAGPSLPICKGSFTRPISGTNFALSQCVFQNIIFFYFLRMPLPTAKSD